MDGCARVQRREGSLIENLRLSAALVGALLLVFSACPAGPAGADAGGRRMKLLSKEVFLYDDYAVSVSRDNGRTWSRPEVRCKSAVTSEGRVRYGEPAAFFDVEREKLIVLVDKTLYPKDKLDVDADYQLALDVYDASSESWCERRVLQFPGHRSPAMSFSFPIKSSRGRLLFPGMRKSVDASGKAVHFQGCWAPVDEVVRGLLEPT